jgi:predicted RNA-binding Zn-ribbon protein involved in translation (DUF1610 family)
MIDPGVHFQKMLFCGGSRVTKLSEMPFKSLQAGMKFCHPQYGEQIIMDLDRNSYGPVIKFHGCDVYSGKLPEISDEEEDIFQILAKTTFPCGAEDWEYQAMATPEQITAHGWQWFEIRCPHCGSVHRFLAQKSSSTQRQCLVCGMTHNRPSQPNSSIDKH